MEAIKEFLLRRYRRVKKKCNTFIVKTANRLMAVFPIQEHTVLFLSDVRQELGGNLKCLYDRIPDDKYKKIISTKADRRIRRPFKEKINLVYYLTVAKYILLDDFSRTTSNIRVRKNQELIQLWHGPGAFKKFGHSRGPEHQGDVEVVHPGYKKYTGATVSSEAIRPCYAEAFGIDISKIKATGFPRTDIFFDPKQIEQHREEVYQKYPFLKGKKVILFAPTYRGTKVSEAYFDFDKLDIEKIYREFSGEYIFIFKWHPALYNNILFGNVEGYDLERYSDFFYDLSNERDINDLLLIADVLITDYSSVIFDYYFLNKPVIYFVYDLKEYENGRGLYFPFEEYIYGDVAVTDDELIEAIKAERLDQEARERFYDKFMGACDGHSTEKTYQWIFESQKEGN